MSENGFFSEYAKGRLNVPSGKWPSTTLAHGLGKWDRKAKEERRLSGAGDAATALAVGTTGSGPTLLVISILSFLILPNETVIGATGLAFSAIGGFTAAVAKKEENAWPALLITTGIGLAMTSAAIYGVNTNPILHEGAVTNFIGNYMQNSPGRGLLGVGMTVAGEIGIIIGLKKTAINLFKRSRIIAASLTATIGLGLSGLTYTTLHSVKLSGPTSPQISYQPNSLDNNSYMEPK